MPADVEDPGFWKKSGIVIILKMIRQLIEAIKEDPLNGTGKPERLKYEWSEWWSRRINEEHRIVYKFDDEKITVYPLRYHYQK